MFKNECGDEYSYVNSFVISVRKFVSFKFKCSPATDKLSIRADPFHFVYDEWSTFSSFCEDSFSRCASKARMDLTVRKLDFSILRRWLDDLLGNRIEFSFFVSRTNNLFFTPFTGNDVSIY